jgi:hypothetical protein
MLVSTNPAGTKKGKLEEGTKPRTQGNRLKGTRPRHLRRWKVN